MNTLSLRMMALMYSRRAMIDWPRTRMLVLSNSFVDQINFRSRGRISVMSHR